MKKNFIIILAVLASLGVHGQTAHYEEWMAEGRRYFDQKEYVRSSECYERVINELRGTDYEGLIPTVRSQIAINNLYLGVAAIKAKDFDKAKPLLEKAIADAKEGSKAHAMALSWMGQWHSVQSQSIRTVQGDMERALQLSLEAERYFDLSGGTEKRLREQLARADILTNLAREDEALALLQAIADECGDDGGGGRPFIKGKALYKMGYMDMEQERYDQAIDHLEKAFTLCGTDTTVNGCTYAMLVAEKLSALYTKHIPDSEKAALWQQRADALEPKSLRNK